MAGENVILSLCNDKMQGLGFSPREKMATSASPKEASVSTFNIFRPVPNIFCNQPTG